VAGCQHGVVARRQLLAASVSNSTIARMISSGWLIRVHAGVYALAGIPLTRYARWMAAVLAAGRGAVLSHTSAGALWGFIAPLPGPVHVTVPHENGLARARDGRRGIILHRTRDLPDPQRDTRQRIPATSASRTLLDLAGLLSPMQLRRALEAADRLDLLHIEELTRLREQRRGRKGTGRLRSLLARHRPLPDTRSELERRFLRLCQDAGLPMPAVNVPVEGLEVDFLWPDLRLVVELDGYAFHRDRAAFERDRRRDAALQLAGYRVIRVTHRRLVEEPAAVVAELRALLGLA
jgi:very-short-patch-repair endonuclease